MTTVVNSESGSGAGMVILALVIAALVGLGVWFFAGGSSVTNVTHNTTIEAPQAPSMPAPSMPEAPSAPSGQ